MRFSLRILSSLVFSATSLFAVTTTAPTWTAREISLIKSLELSQLAFYPTYQSGNAVAQNPNAQKLGKMLFFDSALSKTGDVSCSSCHDPEYQFTDPLPLSIGVGVTDRSSMTVVNAHYAPFQFWDGRKDSLWSQALAPLESPVEHGTSRQHAVTLVLNDPLYLSLYEKTFGSNNESVDRVFANIGKAIASYESSLYLKPSRFDKFARALENQESPSHLTVDEQKGLKLFLGKAQCVTCHFGPLFTNHAFHRTGVPQAGVLADLGRFTGVEDLIKDPFNCLGVFSDAQNKDKDCAETKFATRNDERLKASFKVPGLRNVSLSAPYMHAGQFDSLEAVIDHYNRPPKSPAGPVEIGDLNLTDREKQELIKFLQSLASEIVDPIVP